MTKPLKLTTELPEVSLHSARAVMDRGCHLPLDLDHIAGCAGFSRYHFIRIFRRAFGVTPHQYLIQRRIEKAQALLTHTDLTITEICFAVGFQSLGSFSTLFHRQTGQSPSAYRIHALEQKRRLHRAAPNCFLSMFAGSH